MNTIDAKKTVKVGLLGKKKKQTESFESLHHNLEMFYVQRGLGIEYLEIETEDDIKNSDIIVMPGGPLVLDTLSMQDYL